MQPYYSNGVATLYHANALDLGFLPAESVHMVCTSPPYWAQRDYGLSPLIWDGTQGCQHDWGPALYQRQRGSLHGANAQAGNTLAGVSGVGVQQGNLCQHCAAWSGSLGLEPTPELYVQHLVQIFAEVKRVLRSDGVLWLNMGDSYAGGGNNRGNTNPLNKRQASNSGATGQVGPGRVPSELKALDLIGLPHRVAFALRAEGWYLRSEIIWVKGREHEDGTLGLNPMPESMTGWKWQRCRIKIAKRPNAAPRIKAKDAKYTESKMGWSPSNLTDGEAPFVARYIDCPGCEICLPNDGLILRKGAWRPTDAFEYIFMLTKSPVYFADQEAIRVPHADVSIARYMRGSSYDGSKPYAMKHGPSGHGIQKWDADGMPTWVKGHSGYLKADGTVMINAAGANPRNVWVFPSEPTTEKHFATYPRELPRRCIRAATSEHGVCGKCGSQYAPVVEAPQWEKHQSERDAGIDVPGSPMYRQGSHNDGLPWVGSPKVLGYRPTCGCNAPRGQAVVLDPFCGSGTTLVAAQELGRQSIGIDLSEPYLQIARHRIEGLSLPMAAHLAEEEQPRVLGR